MDTFDDPQIEESRGFDFGEASYDRLFEEEEDEEYFFSRMNSNYDF